MTKLTKQQKLEIYDKRKSGSTLTKLELEYGLHKHHIHYLIKLIDIHGKEILDRNGNRYYPPDLKKEIIDKVLIDKQSINTTSLEFGLTSDGMLINWIKQYKKDGYVIVEKPRGRSPTMPKVKEKPKKYKDMTPEEKVKYLEEKNHYLEAENEFLKKLDTVVQQRLERERKK